MDGWIKLHRQIVSSSKFADPDILRLWIYCLTKASHKSGSVVIDKQEVLLQPGQFITGRFALDEDYNKLLSPRKRIKDTTLWSWLKRLEEWGDLDIKSTNKYSVVTVLKWHDYQETLTTELQQIDNKLTAEPQQTDTNKNVKNEKNLKKEKKDQVIKREYAPFIFLTEEEHLKLTELLGEDERESYFLRFASWISGQTKRVQESRSAYLSILNWHREDKKKVVQLQNRNPSNYQKTVSELQRIRNEAEAEMREQGRSHHAY